MTNKTTGRIYFMDGEYYEIIEYKCLACGSSIDDIKHDCYHCGGRYLDPVLKPLPKYC